MVNYLFFGGGGGGTIPGHRHVFWTKQSAPRMRDLSIWLQKSNCFELSIFCWCWALSKFSQVLHSEAWALRAAWITWAFLESLAVCTELPGTLILAGTKTHCVVERKGWPTAQEYGKTKSCEYTHVFDLLAQLLLEFSKQKVYPTCACHIL